MTDEQFTQMMAKLDEILTATNTVGTNTKWLSSMATTLTTANNHLANIDNETDNLAPIAASTASIDKDTTTLIDTTDQMNAQDKTKMKKISHDMGYREYSKDEIQGEIEGEV